MTILYFITSAIQVGKQVEDEKLAALGARNKLKSMTEARQVTLLKINLLATTLLLFILQKATASTIDCIDRGEKTRV